MKAKCIDNTELELLPDTASGVHAAAFVLPTLPAWLSQVWNWLNKALFEEPELQIREMSDRVGNTWWHIYDPRTGKTAWLDSENEVLIWIEKNY